MDNRIDIKIDHDIQLMVETYVGNVSIEHVVEYTKKKWKDMDHDIAFPVITDLRYGEFKFSKQEIFAMIDLYKNNKIIRKNSSLQKHAIVAQTPIQTVFAIMLKNKIYSYGKGSLFIEIFYSYESALHWILN